MVQFYKSNTGIYNPKNINYYNIVTMKTVYTYCVVVLTLLLKIKQLLHKKYSVKSLWHIRFYIYLFLKKLRSHICLSVIDIFFLFLNININLYYIFFLLHIFIT